MHFEETLMDLGFQLSVKMHFLNSHLSYFPDNCRNDSEKQRAISFWFLKLTGSRTPIESSERLLDPHPIFKIQNFFIKTLAVLYYKLLAEQFENSLIITSQWLACSCFLSLHSTLNRGIALERASRIS